MKDRSPCVTCERADQNKDRCVSLCERLDAFRDGRPWDGLSLPVIEMEAPAADEDNGSPAKKEDGMAKICKVDGCETKAVARGLCLKHYDMWRHDKLPGYPPFKPVQKRGRKKKPTAAAPAKKTKPPKPDNSQKLKGQTVHSTADFLFRVDLTLYPKIRRTVVETADKFMVPPEHVMISLMGEGLAARQTQRAS